MFRFHRRRKHKATSGRGQRFPAVPLRVEALEDRTVPTAGLLDPTFGTGGLVTTDFRSTAQDTAADLVVVQSDGKTVVAGTVTLGDSDFALVRYNPDGSLDTTFGTGGRVITNVGFPDEAHGLAVQDDGKLVLVGSSFVSSTTAFDSTILRYNSDGSLDASFGGDGIVQMHFPGVDAAQAAAIQGDGKIVVALTSGGDFTLMRFNTDGSLDTSFDGDGKVTTDFGGFDQAFDVGIQGDGKIVAVGRSVADGARVALARYNPDGSLDPGFDGDGKVTTSLSSIFSPSARSLAIQKDGKIVVADVSDIVRYNPDGSLDTSFDTDGVVTTGLGAVGGAVGVTVQGDGKIVVAGGSGDFVVARYNPDGSPDTSFSQDGRATTDFGSFDRARGVALQPDGRIIVAGQTQLSAFSSQSDFAVARYNPDGSPDTSFGGDGTVTTNVGRPQFDSANNLVAVQADGKLVVVGSTLVRPPGGGSSRHFAVARYNRDGTLDTSFSDDGLTTTQFASSSSFEQSVASAVLLLEDGKILVAGTVVIPGDFGPPVVSFALARYNPDGSLDLSFGGGDGKAEYGPGGSGSTAIIQNDGKIVVAGGSQGSLTVVRFNRDGSPDNGGASDSTPGDSFDGDGIATAPFAGRVSSIAFQPDGKVVAVGTDAIGFVVGDFVVARYNADLSPDTSFSQDGTITTDFGGLDQASGVALQPDGRIIVAGSTRDSSGSDFALARYTSTGDLDGTFGVRGKVTTDYGNSFDEAVAVAIQTNGRIVVVGVVSPPAISDNPDFALARYTSDGTLDMNFGTGGKVITDFAGGSDRAAAVAIQADGKIIVAGQTFSAFGQADFALARYEGVGANDAALNKVIEVIADVQALVAAGTLNHGQGKGLLAKLQAAVQQLDGNNTAAAVNQLEAFINQVNDFIAEGTLTPAQGQPLIDKANVAIALLTGSPLLAAGGPGEQGAGGPLTEVALAPLVAEALARWQAAGADTSTLAAVTVRVADLGGAYLGLASGDSVWLDDNAAGWGWFVDPTPGDDSEFTTPGDQGEEGRIDLLTVLTHELGHVLGFGHDHEGVMAEMLAAGTRRTPEVYPMSPLDSYFSAGQEWDRAALAAALGGDEKRKA